MHSSEKDGEKFCKKFTEVGNHVGYLCIFQPSVSITAIPVPENLNMVPYGKTLLVLLFWVGTVFDLYYINKPKISYKPKGSSSRQFEGDSQRKQKERQINLI